MCTDTLKVFNGGDLLETVLVTGRAVEAGGPDRDPKGTIVIGERDTGVVDRLHEGKLISERIDDCAAAAKNHGQFVRCVSALANELKRAGAISGKDRGAIQKCAALEKFPHRPRRRCVGMVSLKGGLIMDIGLNGKIVVVTGAARGIGREIWTRFASTESRVIGVDVAEMGRWFSLVVSGKRGTTSKMEITSALDS